MSATQLLLHHRYRNNMAYDWSRLNNHGHLVGVDTSTGHLHFDGGADRVEVRPSSSLRDFGELRVRVVFRPDPTIGFLQRFNLVEGEFSFAVVRDADRSVSGTINCPGVGWKGVHSAPGSVEPDQWHVVDFIHDGVSHARLYLDGALVDENYDVPGPIPNLGGRGVWIGHWPGDDRYTMRGELDEVQIWKDDPKKDAGQVIDDCCLDEEWIDQRVGEARRQGWDAENARERLADFFAKARAATAEVRGGDQARTAVMAGLTQQGLNAMAQRDADGLGVTLQTLGTLVTAQLGAPRVDQLGHELWDALKATPLGIWMGQTEQEALAFFQEAAEHLCLDGLVPRDPKRPRPKPPPTDGGQPPGDPDTDHEPPADPKPAHDQVPDRPDDPGRPDIPTRPDTPTRPDERRPR
jgi:hypothetical protein